MGSLEILSVASDLPQQCVASKDLLDKASGHLSTQVIDMLQSMDIDKRYSVVENYPQYLAGEEQRKLMSGVNELGANSIRKCLAQFPHDLDVGLLIAVTNTAERPLPCMAYELISMMDDDMMPHDINIINMQNQGCSALIKAFEIASYFLKAHPHKHVVISVAETHTAMVSSVLANKSIVSFGEIKEIQDVTEQKEAQMALNNLINSYLFGDGAVSLLLGHGTQEDSFESYHLTNIDASDSEILCMNEGGSKIPCYQNFPQYTLGKVVPARGARYSELLLRQAISQNNDHLTQEDINFYLIHTGSKKIISAVQKNLMLDDQMDKISVSYFVLKNYGNLSSCSIGFMLERLINQQKVNGTLLLISFGVGFSGSVAKLKI